MCVINLYLVSDMLSQRDSMTSMSEVLNYILISITVYIKANQLSFLQLGWISGTNLLRHSDAKSRNYSLDFFVNATESVMDGNLLSTLSIFLTVKKCI